MLSCSRAPPTMSKRDVDAEAAGQRHHRVADIGLLVVDHLVGAELARRGELRIRTGRGDDAGAGQPGDLDAGGADAAAGGIDEDRLAGGQPADLDDRLPRGRERDLRRHRVLLVEIRRADGRRCSREPSRTARRCPRS